MQSTTDDLSSTGVQMTKGRSGGGLPPLCFVLFLCHLPWGRSMPLSGSVFSGSHAPVNTKRKRHEKRKKRNSLVVADSFGGPPRCASVRWLARAVAASWCRATTTALSSQCGRHSSGQLRAPKDLTVSRLSDDGSVFVVGGKDATSGRWRRI